MVLYYNFIKKRPSNGHFFTQNLKKFTKKIKENENFTNLVCVENKFKKSLYVSTGKAPQSVFQTRFLKSSCTIF